MSNHQDIMKPDEVGQSIVPVLACVLNQLCARNDRLPQKGVSKFHALRPPAIGIKDYLQRILKYAACSGECFVLALVYIDRIIQSNPTFVVNSLNIHRLLITSVMLAAKFFDDQYFNNAYYAKVGGIPCHEMNTLEVEFLFMTNFTLFVNTDTYTQYYTELCNHASNPHNTCHCSTQRVPELIIPFVDNDPVQDLARQTEREYAQQHGQQYISPKQKTPPRQTQPEITSDGSGSDHTSGTDNSQPGNKRYSSNSTGSGSSGSHSNDPAHEAAVASATSQMQQQQLNQPSHSHAHSQGFQPPNQMQQHSGSYMMTDSPAVHNNTEQLPFANASTPFDPASQYQQPVAPIAVNPAATGYYPAQHYSQQYAPTTGSMPPQQSNYYNASAPFQPQQFRQPQPLQHAQRQQPAASSSAGGNYYAQQGHSHYDAYQQQHIPQYYHGSTSSVPIPSRTARHHSEHTQNHSPTVNAF